MGLEESLVTLKAVQAIADDVQKRADKIAFELCSVVRDDFDLYMKTYLNPLLPSGYRYEGGCSVTYERGFIITMGSCKSPLGQGTDFWPGEEAYKLVRGYKEIHPLVSRINSSFRSPK